MIYLLAKVSEDELDGVMSFFPLDTTIPVIERRAFGIMTNTIAAHRV